MFSIGTTKYEDIIRETSLEDSSTSIETISDWISYSREVTLNWCEQEEEKGKIGGENIVVEIDELKIGKRKYNKGRRVDGVWIFGMIEIQYGDVARRGGKFRLEVCAENKRDAAIIIPIIEKHVYPGTTIVSDMWRGYYRLSDFDFTNFTQMKLLQTLKQ